MKIRIPVLACAVAFGFVATSTLAVAAAAPSRAIKTAVADTSRPEADRARDANRKPAELIAFAGIKAGDKVAELLPGGGYFTRIFSKVVGTKGVVYAMAPVRPANAPADAPDRAAPVKAIAAESGYGNVRVVDMDEKLGSMDVVWTSQNYHDLHNAPNADLVATNKRVRDMLKPGGIYIVIDHAAQTGSGARDTNTLHRIDAELVKQEVLAAGFELVGESNALRNPADMHDKRVFDESLRGNTDQFALKFRRKK
jgi:predicted methyltransferase